MWTNTLVHVHCTHNTYVHTIFLLVSDLDKVVMKWEMDIFLRLPKTFVDGIVIFTSFLMANVTCGRCSLGQTTSNDDDENNDKIFSFLGAKLP